jgi:fibronectin-binding autotransporter adhesin
MSRNLFRSSALRPAWAALIVAALPAVAMAQASSSYTGLATPGSWTTAGNWTPATVPNGTGSVASFAGGQFTSGGAASGYITANISVNQDQTGLTLSGINFNNVANGFAYTIAAGTGGSITFVDPGTGTATINFTANSNLTGSTIAAPIVLNTNLTFTSAANSLDTMTVSGAISGSSGIIVTTSAAHDEVGFVTLSSATSSFTGGVTLNSGGLQPGASTTGSAGAVTAGPLGTGTLTVNGGVLLTSTVTLANAIALNANLIYAGGSGADTLSGVISNGLTGSGGITNQSRGSTLSLTNADTYTGPTFVRNEPIPITNAAPAVGTISFSGATGSALSSSSFTAQGGGTILLDSSGIASAIVRIGSGAGVNLNNGIFTIKSGTTTTTPTSFTQSAGILTGNGTNVVNISTATGAATTEGVDLSFSSLARAGNSTFLFNGTAAFGTAANGLGVSQLTFTTPPTLVGAGALLSKSAPIIPYAVGSSSATPTSGTGTDLVTYDTNGVRLLQAAEYNTALTPANAGTNIKLTAAGGTITNNANLSVQALVLSPASGADTLSGTGTLTFTSGTILSTTSGTNTINNNVNFGSAEGVIFVSSSLSNNVQINGVVSGTGGLTKGGPGVLLLTPTSPYGNTYTGPTTLNGGLTLLTDQRAFGASTSTVQLWGSTSGNNAGIQDTTPGLALNLTRNIGINDGNISLDANQSRGALIVAGNISGGGGIWIANNATAGFTLLAGTNTFTGEIRIDSGNLGIASDANLGAGPAFDIGTNVTATNPPLGLRLFGNLTTSKLMNITSSSTFDTGAFNATLNGPVTDFGTENLIKFGSGTLQFTNAQNGVVQLTVDNGTVKVSGSSHLINATLGGIAINSGSLTLDYTAAPTVPKLSTSQNVQFGTTLTGIGNGGGGTLELDAGGNTVNQQIAAITVPLATATTAASAARIRLNAGGGAGNITLNVGTLAYSNSINTANSSLFIAGDGLGSTTKVFFNAFTVNGVATTTPLIGGAYAANVGTPTLGILPGGYGDTAATGNGTDLLTYDNSAGGVGARLLTAAEYVTNFTGTPNTNVKINTPTASNPGDAINAVVVTGSSRLAVQGTLNVASGTILSTASTPGSPNVINGIGTGGGGGTLAGTTTGAISGFNFAVPTDLLVNTVLLGGTGALIKTGPGTMTFDPLSAGGASLATSTLGSVNIYEGTLAVTDPTATLGVLGTGPFYFANNATFKFGGVGTGTAQVLNLNGSGGTLDLTGTFLQTTGLTNQINGSGALTLAGGTLLIGNNNAATNGYQGGTNLNGGTLAIFSTGAAPLGLGLLSLNGGQLAPFKATRTIAIETAVTANTTFVNNLTVGANVDTSNSGLTFSVPVRLEASVTLTNNMVGGSATFNGSVYDDPFNAPATLTLAAGAGAGPFVFSLSNSYRGGTIVNSGATLQLTNTFGSGTGSGPVTVNSGAVLKGTGFIQPTQGSEAANLVTINSGGIIAPGNSPGTLTVGSPTTPGVTTATVNETAGSFFRFVYTSTPAPVQAALDSGGSQVAGSTTGNNLLAVNGSLVLSAGTNFQIFGNEADFLPGGTYSFLIGTATSIPQSYMIDSVDNPGQFDTTNFTNFTPGEFYMYVHNVGNNEYFNLSPTPVPEPSSFLLLGAGAAVIGAIRRRRRRRA